MRYIIDIVEFHTEAINRLILEGKYNSVAQFISAAIENQIYLEDTDITKPYYKPRGTLPPEKGVSVDSNELDFSLIKTVKYPEIDETIFTKQKSGNNEKWLWGQINRIFPMKVALRSMINLLGDSEWISLTEFKDHATKYAINIGDKLRDYERVTNKLRGEKVSTGLPTVANYKSHDRYKFHFLTIMRSDGLLDGALGVLRFINIKKESSKKLYVGITKQGLSFAKLKNPVLDSNDMGQSLSQEEIAFYLKHVKDYAPYEWNAINWMVENIGSKGVTRETLNEVVSDTFRVKWKCSEAIINTQRAGLVARMFELGLLRKEKQGVNVTYHLSEFGESLLINK